MQPSNLRSEMSSKNQPTPSGVEGALPNGKGAAPNNSQQQTDEPRRLSLAELFADDGENSEETNSSFDDPSKPPDSMEVLSKRLGFKPEQLYEVKIPLRDGAEPLTIGQLKDRIAEVVDLEQREMQFDQRRVKQEGEMLRAQTEIREILAMLPKESIKPEMVNKIRQRHEANMQRERQATLEHIPEWHDEKRRTEDIQGMIDLLADYGFDEGFIASVTDHRAIKFIRDMYIRDKRIKAALAKVTTPDGKNMRGSAKAKKPAARPVQPSRQTRGEPDSRAKLAALFNSPSE